MTMRVPAAVFAVAVIATACSGGGDSADPPDGAGTATPTEATAPPPPPPEGRCYRLTFDEALASAAPPQQDRPCRRPHTTETYAVERLDILVDGHQVAVDSERVQDQVARRCPAALPDFLGAERDVVRRSMIRPIWFTPTLEEAGAGAQWMRCDAVVVGGDRRLERTSGSLRNALSEDLPDRYAMCGTAAPDAEGFERVVCSGEHSWRAVAVVGFDARKYPGKATARQRGQDTCETVGADHASDPLDYRWSYEWPTREQWTSGMTFGRCWVPE